MTWDIGAKLPGVDCEVSVHSRDTMHCALGHTDHPGAESSSIPVAHSQVYAKALRAPDSLPGSKPFLQIVEESYSCVEMFSWSLLTCNF